MLVIDETKLKLLKMKEKLLEVMIEDNKNVLKDYKDLAIEIDKSLYESLLEKIKSTNYNSLPLEEQISFLSEIENDYNEYNEFRCKCLNTFELYSDEELILSPISNIVIDNIKERISTISGYLINNKNLEKDRKELEKLNLELITEEKKKSSIEEKYLSLEKELKINLINAEGRIYDYNGNKKYTSIIEEYNGINIDLRHILDNPEELENKLKETKELLNGEKEKLKAIEVCYNNIQNNETKELYQKSKIDNIKIEYKLILLEIANLISKELSDYKEIKTKRQTILELIKSRKNCLNKLNISVSIDPFDRIKIQEQLEIISSLGNSELSLSSVKSRIQELVLKTEEMTNKNNELMILINDKVALIKDTLSVSDIIEFSNIDVNDKNETNKIINIKELPPQFKLNLVKEKTNGVLERVYELFNNVNIVNKTEEVSPQLVIEENHNEENNEIEIKYENNASDPFKEVSLDLPLVNTKEEPKVSLFTETEPFEKISLFNDRYEDNVFNDTNNDNKETIIANNNNKSNIEVEKELDTMPEMFWTPQEDNQDSEEKESISFDEQIEALMNEPDTKVKKLVA